jgi:hypothetical protein
MELPFLAMLNAYDSMALFGAGAFGVLTSLFLIFSYFAAILLLIFGALGTFVSLGKINDFKIFGLTAKFFTELLVYIYGGLMLLAFIFAVVLSADSEGAALGVGVFALFLLALFAAVLQIIFRLTSENSGDAYKAPADEDSRGGN